MKIVETVSEMRILPVVLLGTESIRTQVNSYLGQFVLILVNSYSVFGQFVLILLNLVNSYSFWSIRTHTKNMILIIYIILLKIDR